MRIALCTLMDDNFFIGFVGFWKSFIEYNPWFSYDFVVLNNGISEDNQAKMLEMCSSIIFRKIRKKNYADTNFSKTHDRLKATYYTLEVFNLTEYDRVVFLDMDITVLDNIKVLFESKDDIRACRAYNAKLDMLSDSINSGVFTINDGALNKHVYNSLIRMSRRGQSMPDQRIINGFFKGKMQYFDKRYNVEKRMLHSTNHRDEFDEAKILHWVASKPWEAVKENKREEEFIELEKVWWKYYNEK